GAGYIDAGLAAAAEMTGRSSPALDDVRFVTPLVVEDHDVPTLRLSAERASGRFSVSSRSGGASGWTRHAHGRIVDALLRPTLALPALTASTRVTADELYPQLAERGLAYGPAFRRIIDAEVGDGRLVARIDAAGTGVGHSNHQAHPTVLDAALQCVALLADDNASDGVLVPAGVRHVRQFGVLPDHVLVGVTRQDPRPGEPELVADVVLTDLDDRVLIELHRVQFRPISPRPPVLTRLERLWAEPRFEAREARDVIGRDQALAGERVLVIAAGESSTGWADDYAARRAAEPAVRVVGADPAPICAAAEAALRALLASDPDDTRPVVVTLVVAADDQPVSAAAAERAGELAAMLAGTARALQIVTDEAPWEGSKLTIHGLVITSGALPARVGDVAPDVAASALVGARRVLRNEQPLLSWRLVDVDHASGADTVLLECLASGSYADDDVDEVALRGDQRMVVVTKSTLAERLAELETVRPLAGPEANFEIAVPPSGLLADLALREIVRPAPGYGEIEIRIEGIGLNFKDPMKVLGVLGEAELAGTHFGLNIGMEGMGVVTRIGPGVTGIRVGESRFVAVAGMAQRYVITRPDADETIPGHDLPLAAYGSVVVLMTAHYALKHAARMQPGEWVLVTGGAGGVGMAGVQIAAKAGARVIATASTPERADLLRRLGARHVVDSRSLSSIEEVRGLTDGHGADVIINAAPGEAVVANLEVAAEFGRVVEVGKTEIFGGRLLDMAVFNKNLSLISIDLDRMMAHRRDLMAQVSDDVLGLIESGDYDLLPTTILPVSRLAEAFDQVARSNQLGRVVLDFREPTPLVKPGRPVAPVRPDAAYLITGGLGDFGLATAAWLAARGAGTIVLAGRRGAFTDFQRAAVAALAAGGTDVRVERLDVADRHSVDLLLARLSEGPPLRGVFHAAGVLADESVPALSVSGLEAVLSAKARGALNLHDALLQADLDMFVLYSSVTSVAGTVPQFSYAAANSLLDWLAHYRRSIGLHGLSVNWGSLGGGMATSSQEVATYLALNGLRPIPLTDACEYLDAAIAIGDAQVVIADIDMAVWGSMHPASAGTPRFADQVSAARASDAADGAMRAELATMPVEQRVEKLTALLADVVAAVLGIPSASVDAQTPLPDLGLDSLMAVELRARINMTLEVEISAMELNRGGGLSSLANRLAEQLATPR
ncbi:MAG TPA: KR domain-containing protein, partial [Mycobacterium sp.]